MNEWTRKNPVSCPVFLAFPGLIVTWLKSSVMLFFNFLVMHGEVRDSIYHAFELFWT